MLTSGAAAQEDDLVGGAKPLLARGGAAGRAAAEAGERDAVARRYGSRAAAVRRGPEGAAATTARPSATPGARRRRRASSSTRPRRWRRRTTSRGTSPIPSSTICAARRSSRWGATKRRCASIASPSSRSVPTPEARMAKLWLARIYARRGYVVLADRVYESMLPPPPKFDEEVALNQADAHLLNKDWEGGARVLRRYLALDPKNVRGRQMLAWALEADGDLDGELGGAPQPGRRSSDRREPARLRTGARTRGQLPRRQPAVPRRAGRRRRAPTTRW